MLNYNLNINSQLQQDKKNEDIRIPIFWTFQSVASASDSTDLGESGYASMSIYAPDSNALGIANDGSGNFDTDAQFYVRATLSGSNWPVTGSTTMSIFTSGITYDPLAINQYYFQAFSASAAEIVANPSITGSVIQNDYSASEFYRFFNDARVTHMKGNSSNSVIKWYVTGSSDRYLTSSSLNIKKDANITEVSQSLEIETGSQFTNVYALNQTASILSNYQPYLSADSSSVNIAKIDLKVSQINFTSSAWISQSSAPQTNSITASFVASETVPEYVISGSLIEYQIPTFAINVTAAGGGGGGGANPAIQAAGGGGGGMVVSASLVIVPNITYNIYVASGSAISASGDNTTFSGYNNFPVNTYYMFAGGGQAGDTGNVNPIYGAMGGDSGIGYIVEGSVTSSFYPKFSGGTGSIQGSSFGPRWSAGGGASNEFAGGNGIIQVQGGDGANGFTAGGGGSQRGSGPTPPPPGRQGFNGSGITGQGGGYGAGGQKGALYVSYIGSGSRFTTTNAVISYNGGTNVTTYEFLAGSGSLAYIAQPTI
jgi:hypothetical protein